MIEKWYKMSAMCVQEEPYTDFIMYKWWGDLVFREISYETTSEREQKKKTNGELNGYVQLGVRVTN